MCYSKSGAYVPAQCHLNWYNLPWEVCFGFTSQLCQRNWKYMLETIKVFFILQELLEFWPLICCNSMWFTQLPDVQKTCRWSNRSLLRTEAAVSSVNCAAIPDCPDWRSCSEHQAVLFTLLTQEFAQEPERGSSASINILTEVKRPERILTDKAKEVTM